MNVHEVVLNRNYFYQRLVVYQTLLMALLVTGLVLNIYFFRTIYSDQMKPTYFMTDSEGAMLLDIPRSEPLYTDEEIESWVTDKITDVFSLNYFNYRKHFNRLAHDFDQVGYVGFMNALKENRLLSAILKNRYIARVSVTKPFTVARHLVNNDTYGWILTGDILVEYVNQENRRNPFRQEMQMLVYVTRQSLFMYPKGIAFMVIIAE